MNFTSCWLLLFWFHLTKIKIDYRTVVKSAESVILFCEFIIGSVLCFIVVVVVVNGNWPIQLERHSFAISFYLLSSQIQRERKKEKVERKSGFRDTVSFFIHLLCKFSYTHPKSGDQREYTHINGNLINQYYRQPKFFLL